MLDFDEWNAIYPQKKNRKNRIRTKTRISIKDTYFIFCLIIKRHVLKNIFTIYM